MLNAMCYCILLDGNKIELYMLHTYCTYVQISLTKQILLYLFTWLQTHCLFGLKKKMTCFCVKEKKIFRNLKVTNCIYSYDNV